MLEDQLRTTTVTIADGQSLSGATAAVSGMKVIGAIVPAANWTAAKLTFQGSIDGTVFADVYGASAEYETPELAAGDAAALNPEVMAPWRYIKVRSGTSGAAVVQAGGDVVTLIMEARR